MRKFAVGIVLSLWVVATVSAQDTPKFEFAKKGKFSKTTLGKAYTKLFRQGFDIRCWMSNEIAFGNQAAPNPLHTIGCDYPDGASNEHIYGGGPVIGD